MRRALVLSSGGARASFELGVLEELIASRGLDFQIMCGISAGALNACVLAQAEYVKDDPDLSLRNLQESYRELRSLWMDRITGNGSVYVPRLFGKAGLVLGADSIYDTTPLRVQLEEVVSVHRLRTSKRDLCVQYAVLETGQLESVMGTDDDVLLKILASATIPVFFPPVVINGRHLVDGGVRDNAPLSNAFAMNPPPDIIYVVYASPANLEPLVLDDSQTGFGVGAEALIMRTIEILLNEIDLTDVEMALKLNALKRSWDALKSKLPKNNKHVKEIDAELKNIRYAKIIEVRPERMIVPDGLDFSPDKLRANYEHGRQMASRIPAEDKLEDSLRLTVA